MHRTISIAAVAAALVGALAPGAAAQECRGLECSGALPESAATITGASARVEAARAKEAREATKATNKDKKTTRKARAAQEPGTCPSGWFCLFDFDDYVGDRGIWQTTSTWQNLSAYGWDNRAESMQNRRSGATLLAYGTGGGGGQRYCAQANSSDSDFSNNASISNNASSLYNSTAAAYHSSWDCFNPY